MSDGVLAERYAAVARSGGIVADEIIGNLCPRGTDIKGPAFKTACGGSGVVALFTGFFLPMC